MNKRETDSAINWLFIKYVLGPCSLLCLAAFAVGYWYPPAVFVAQNIAQTIGLNNLVANRLGNSEFNSAAYLYWLTFWITLPFDLLWLHYTAINQKFLIAIRFIVNLSLANGHWDLKKYGLYTGAMRFLLYFLLFFGMTTLHLISAIEPSTCKGCETSSAIGFIVINWLMTHISILLCYWSASYLVMWKSIRSTF